MWTRDSARMPYGERNSRSIQHDLQDACAAAGDRRSTAAAARRWPGARIEATLCGQVGPVVDEPLHPPLESGQTIQQLRLQRVHREQRNQPDHRSHPQRKRCAVRQVQDVVEEAVLFVPQLDTVAAQLFHRVWRCRGSAPRTCWRHPRTPGSLVRELQRDRQHGSGSTSPSSWCRRTVRDARPSAAASTAVEHADVVEPRKPPSKTLLPSASLRLTHHVKFSSSLWKTRSRKARSPSPRRFCSIL